MKTGIIAIAAAVGLLSLTAEPAHAHDRALDVSFHLGPAYVRYHDGYRPAYRVHRDWRRYHRHRHHRLHRRWHASHRLWHRCYDGSWHRYYDRDHWRFHERRGRRYR